MFIYLHAIIYRCVARCWRRRQCPPLAFEPQSARQSVCLLFAVGLPGRVRICCPHTFPTDCKRLHGCWRGARLRLCRPCECTLDAHTGSSLVHPCSVAYEFGACSYSARIRRSAIPSREDLPLPCDMFSVQVLPDRDKHYSKHLHGRTLPRRGVPMPALSAALITHKPPPATVAAR